MTIADSVDRDALPRVAPPEAVSLDGRRVAERVAALLAEIEATSDPRLAERTEDLVSMLMQYYGAGIRRILEIADDDDLLEGRLLDDLVRDDLVSSILVIHDLHPADLPTRVQDALDRVRPYLGSHGGDVEVVAIEGDTVRLRMEGSCSSCPSSTVTLNFAIEQAILDAAPEIARIVAEDVAPRATTPLIQLDTRRGARGDALVGRPGSTRTEWLPLDADVTLAGGDLATAELGGVRLVLSRVGSDLYAYRDSCANCRSSLETGRVEEGVLTCRTCGHGYDVRLAGRSVRDEGLHLDPLPLLAAASGVTIAVPVEAAAAGPA